MTASGLVHLVDDDEDVRRALAFLLGTAGFAVKVYESGSAFLEKCEDFQSGCIVSDVRMPGIDGLELQRRVRLQHPRLPVIFITAHYDDEIRQQALSQGAVVFLHKPFDAADLLGAIELTVNRFSND